MGTRHVDGQNATAVHSAIATNPKARIAAAVGAAVLSLVALAWLWTSPTYLDTDAVQYARMALEMRGATPDSALHDATMTRCISLAKVGSTQFYGERANAYLADHPELAARAAAPGYAAAAARYGGDPHWLGACTVFLLDHPVSHDPRYAQIFESRPLLPALSAVANTWLDLESALKLVCCLGMAGAGLLLAFGLRAAGLSWPWALLGQAMLYLTPFGEWGIRPFTEGISGLGLAAFVLGGILTLTKREPLGLVVSLASVAWLIAARSHVAIIAGGAVLVCLLATGAGRRLLRRWQVLVGPVAGIVAGVGVPLALGWPGWAVSLQDLATNHFKRPDTAKPWQAYKAAVRTFLVEYYNPPLLIAGTIVFATVVIVAIAVRPTPAVLVAIIIPVVVGLGNVVAHPTGSTAARLFSPAWLGLVAALAVIVDAAARSWLDQRRWAKKSVSS